MFGLNKSVFVYVIALIAFIFMMLYIWRRVYGLEGYIHILEKKLSNMKKENRELQALLQDEKGLQTDIAEADIIMNKIFMGTCSDGKCSASTQIKISDEPAKPVPPLESSGDDAINSLLENLEDVVVSSVPEDHESVVSMEGVYNRRKLGKMNLDKLKEICVSMNLATEGTKNVLIDRILA